MQKSTNGCHIIDKFQFSSRNKGYFKENRNFEIIKREFVMEKIIYIEEKFHY